MNEIEFYSEVVSKSCQPLRYIRRWVSRKPLQIGLVQKKMAYGVSNSHATDDVTWPLQVLWGCTVGYPSEQLGFLYFYFVMSILRHW